MKKQNSTLILLSLLLIGLGACSKHNTPIEQASQPDLQTQIYSPSSKVTLEGHVAIALPEQTQEDSEARVTLTPGTTLNRKVKLGHKAGTSKTILLLFRRGTETARAKGTITFQTSEEGDPIGKISATIPAGFVPRPGETPVFISGIFGGGASDFDSNGQVNLQVHNETITFAPRSPLTEYDYDLPMYFVDRPLGPSGKQATFSGVCTLYGSLIEIGVVNKLGEAIRPQWFKIATSTLDFAGSVDLATKGSNGYPRWIKKEILVQDPNSDEVGSAIPKVSGQLLKIKGNSLLLDISKENRLYVWGVPSGLQGKVSMTLGELGYTDGYSPKAQTHFAFERSTKRPLQHGRVYPLPVRPLELESGLIISEFYHAGLADGLRNTVAIYNPNQKEIDLTDYYFAKVSMSGGGPYRVTLLMSLNNPTQTITTRYSESVPVRSVGLDRMPIKNKLKSKGLIVLNSYNIVAPFYDNHGSSARDYKQASIRYSIGETIGDNEKRKPMGGGATEAMFLLKGLPATSEITYPFKADMSNVVDNFGLLSDRQIRYQDLLEVRNYFYLYDNQVMRRPDRAMSTPSLLRAHYTLDQQQGGRMNTFQLKNLNNPASWSQTPNANYVVRGFASPKFAEEFGTRTLPSGYGN